MGVTDLIFLDNIEKSFKNNEENRSAIKNFVEKKNIEAIFYPMAFDGNRDHVTTSWIVLDALKNLKSNLNLYGYCVWSPIIPTLTVNIDDEIEQKIKAMEQYKTKIEQLSFIHI